MDINGQGTNNIILQSSDGIKFNVSREIVNQSVVCQDMLNSMGILHLFIEKYNHVAFQTVLMMI